MKQRIWELDAFRGICIIGMVVVHIVYDLSAISGIAMPALFLFLSRWGGIAFILLSGICVTLGHNHLRRGLTVLACGLGISIVTFAMYHLGLAANGIQIYFGILHCLGICMILWSFFRRGNLLLRLGFGLLFILAGFYIESHVQVDHPFGIPLGFLFPGFVTSDYFPLFPNLGYFLIGSVLGDILYRNRQTLFPSINPHMPLIRFMTICGRYSLPIYLIHQPVITGILFLLSLLT